MEKYFEIDVMKCNFLHSTNKIHDYCFGIVIILILRVLLGFFFKVVRPTLQSLYRPNDHGTVLVSFHSMK